MSRGGEMPGGLSRRERQIMDAIYAKGVATAKEVQEVVPNPPSYSSVRSALRLLERKGLLRHRRQGLKYVFEPIVPGERAGVSALRNLARTFFANSASNLVSALLQDANPKVTRKELEKMEAMIREAKQRTRK